ncbi:MAG TPA: glycosyltransferase family 4 protein [Gemmatimonadales bacterium]|jgi:glycosyltransferase involved in cell wall biosynthesis
MRILVVAHNYPRFPGDPAGAYVARLARAAAASGATVQVIAPHSVSAREEEETDQLRVHRFRYAPESLERVGYRGDVRRRALFAPLTLAAIPAYLLRFRSAIRRHTASFHPQVVHAHWWFPAGWLVSGIGVPYIVTCHGSDVRLLERSALLRRASRSVFRRAGAVTAVSQFLATDLERQTDGLRHAVSVTPMPVDVELFGRGLATPKSIPPRLLYAGNLVPSKGVDVLLRAVGVLHQQGIECRLKILGEGSARPDLERLAIALDVGDRVEWSSFVPQDRMPAEYGASTVTVLPTRGQAEGLGLVLVEALLAGSAVVGTPAGGIPEVIQDGETGFLARDGDPDDLADKIRRLLGDPGLRDRLTTEGRARAIETYSSAAAARPFLKLYDALAHDRPAS